MNTVSPLGWPHFLILIIALVLVGVAVVLLKRKKRPSRSIENLALFSSEKNFAYRLKKLLQNSNEDFDSIIPHIEEILLSADVGLDVTEDLIQTIAKQKNLKTNAERMDALKTEMTRRLTPQTDFKIQTEHKPFVIYLVGVNGVGKTTTIGKLAKQFKDQGLKVMLVAADTFRAAAVEQLRIWSEKNQVAFSGGHDGMDPSAVIVDGLQSAVSKKMDVVLVDTAGRLHTKSGLMQELQKMVRMSEKVLQKKPDEIFLVLDAITGQNGFSQAKIFFEAIPVSGIVLTKYDATSKGGIVLAITSATGIPIRYVGMGEGILDLQYFDPHRFIEKIFLNT